jgi:flagellar capping protein FliD
MVDMADWKRELERQLKDLRKEMEQQNGNIRKDMAQQNAALRKDMEHGFAILEKEIEITRKDLERIDEHWKLRHDALVQRIDTQFASLREMLEPMRSIPERVARLEARAGIPAPAQPQ